MGSKTWTRILDIARTHAHTHGWFKLSGYAKNWHVNIGQFIFKSLHHWHFRWDFQIHVLETSTAVFV